MSKKERAFSQMVERKANDVLLADVELRALREEVKTLRAANEELRLVVWRLQATKAQCADVENVSMLTILMAAERDKNLLEDMLAGAAYIANEAIALEKECASNLSYEARRGIKDFKARHANDYLTLQALEELDRNPLSATLNIKAVETSEYESISNFLESESALDSSQSVIIDKVNYFQNKLVIDRLISITEGARRLGIALTVVLIAISLIITFNTIRLVIYIAREEISVMRLVGAEKTPVIGEGECYRSRR